MLQYFIFHGLTANVAQRARKMLEQNKRRPFFPPELNFFQSIKLKLKISPQLDIKSEHCWRKIVKLK